MGYEDGVERLKDLRRTNKLHNVAIDVDETIAAVHKVMTRLYNAEKGTRYTSEDHKDWDFKSIGSNYVEMMGHYVRAWKEFPNEIGMLADVDLIRELAQHYPIDLLTTRSINGSFLASSNPEWTVEETTSGTISGLYVWKAQQKIGFLPIICSPEKINKLEYGYSVLVDDSPTLAVKVEKANAATLLLVDKAYNRDIVESDRIIRVSDANQAFGMLIRANLETGGKKVLYQSDEGQRLIGLGRKRVA